MNKFNEDFNYDDNTEDENSIGTEVKNGFESGEEFIGVLSFGMEKSEAINVIEYLFTMPEEIKSFSNIMTTLSKDSSYNYLTPSNIKEILDYAIKKELIKPFYDDYMRIY